MSFRNMLVHVADGASSDARVDTAVRLAQSFEARLCGIYLVPALQLTSSVASMVPSAVVSQRLEEDAEARTLAEQSFRRRASAARLEKVDWHAPAGDALDAALHHARYSDLFVLGQRDPDDDIAFFTEQLIGTVLLGSGRPILLVPYIGAPAKIGTNVLIATDGGREAARAIADAMPILERAERVEVVMGLRTDFESFESASLRMTEWLADHAIRCRTHPNEADPSVLGEMLLSRAADYGSDLIVMGGYGHSRTRELMLGGMTRTILASMTIPVLMSH